MYQDVFNERREILELRLLNIPVDLQVLSVRGHAHMKIVMANVAHGSFRLLVSGFM